MERVYVDAAPVVYAVERREPWCGAVDHRLAPPDRVVVSSALTRMECLVVPFRERHMTLVDEFRRYFREVVMLTVPLSDTVMDLAAEIRAEYGFRTPDAIHLAAAHAGECDVFYTNDSRLSRFRGITVETVGDPAR